MCVVHVCVCGTVSAYVIKQKHVHACVCVKLLSVNQKIIFR